MANKQSRRQSSRTKRRAAKAHRMTREGAKSNYAKKFNYLGAESRRRDPATGQTHRVFGDQFPVGGKPWK